MRFLNRYHTLKDGLIGAWCPSVTGPSGYYLRDLVSSNPGVLTANFTAGSSYTVIERDYSITLDGTDDYANCGPCYLMDGCTNAITVSCWWRSNAVATKVHRLLGRQNASTSNAGFLLMIEASRTPTWYIWGPTQNTCAAGSNSAPSTTDFYHFAATFDSQTMSIYINGALANAVQALTTIVPADPTISANNNFTIGGNPITTAQYVQGQMDDIRVWNRCLSPQDIRFLSKERGIGLRRERRSRHNQLFVYDKRKSSRYLAFPG